MYEGPPLDKRAVIGARRQPQLSPPLSPQTSGYSWPTQSQRQKTLSHPLHSSSENTRLRKAL